MTSRVDLPSLLFINLLPGCFASSLFVEDLSLVIFEYSFMIQVLGWSFSLVNNRSLFIFLDLPGLAPSLTSVAANREDRVIISTYLLCLLTMMKTSVVLSSLALVWASLMGSAAAEGVDPGTCTFHNIMGKDFFTCLVSSIFL